MAVYSYYNNDDNTSSTYDLTKFTKGENNGCIC